jgi:uncharacterized protein
MSLTPDDVVRLLNLAAHPEGGFFRETFRDTHTVPGTSGRAASTAIYFLLRGGEQSRWHWVDAVEGWHHYAGAPLRLDMAERKADDTFGPILTTTMGSDLSAGQRPQAIVPNGWWQRALCLAPSTQDWSLVGCTVAPGFTFDGFHLLETAKQDVGTT